MAGSARVEVMSWVSHLGFDALRQPSPVSKSAPVAAFSIETRECISISYGTNKVAMVARNNTALEELVAVASMFLLFGWVFFGPWLTFLSLYLALKGSYAAVVFFTAVVGATLAPAPGEWAAFRSWALFDTWRRYHRVHFIVPPLPYLSGAKTYLFAHFPHATFPMGGWLSLGVCGAPETGLPARTKGAVASVIFRLPVMKHFFTWMGCVSADRQTMQAELKDGVSLGVMIEGIAGIFTCTRQRERIYGRHKGYARLAIQTGTDVVPVYHLGSSQVLSFLPLSPTLSRKIKIACGFFHGRFGLPLPLPHQIITVVGDPIPVAQKDLPTQAEVDALNAQVLDALKRIFDEHKHLLPGFADRTLEVLM